MRYDVVIIGAGPAGLKAAEVLASNGKKVVVFEKNKIIGKKVCAGGIAERDLEYIPRKLVEKEFDSFLMISKNNKIRIKNKCYTLERENLGQYLSNKAKRAGAVIKTNTFVKKINKNSVIVDDKEYYFDYLIGADGSNSIVRQFLKIKSKAIALALQYKLNHVRKDLEVHYDPKTYYLWYIWIFPHKNYTSIGTAAPLQSKKRKYLRKTLEDFAKQNNFSVKNKEFEAALINADYIGFRFNNIFLVGDAAGLVNPFTGEGIYQALVSGEEIAKKIIDPAYECKKLRKIVNKHKKLLKLLLVLYKIPTLLRIIYWLGFKLLRYDRFQKRFIRTFLDY